MVRFGLALVGLLIGLALPFGVSGWLKGENATQRGYLNAVAIGIMVAAAVLIIPTALSEVEFASYALVSRVVPASFGETNLIPWSLQFQVVLRSLGVIAILILFLRSNAPLLPEERTALVQAGQPLPLRTKIRTGLALVSDDTIDWVGVVGVTVGLACYTLWLSATEAPLGLGDGSFRFGITLFVGLATAVGISVSGLLPDLERHRLWLMGISLLLGLAAIFGALPLGRRLILSGSPILLAVGAISLIFAIGRLLRIVQDQIGLDWPTTATVGLSGVIVYFSSEFIGRLI